MMKVICITSLLALLNVACVLRFTKTQDNKEETKPYKELQARYYLAFEKHLYVSVDSLYQLDNKTRQVLQEKVLTDEQVIEVKKLHHKLKSYLIFLQIAKPIDANGVIKTEVAAFFLDQLRQQSAEQIDLTADNEEFYQLVRKGQHQKELSALEKRLFVDTLLDKIIVMANESAAKHKVWVEGNSNLPKLTAQINKIIRQLNKVISELNSINSRGRKNFLSFNKVDLTNPEIVFLNQQYEFILMQAANTGILPIFFTESFKKRSGRVNLTSWEGVNNKLLVELTLQTTAKTLQELEQTIANRVQTIKELKKNPKIDDKQVYQLLIDNEVSAAQLILQNPQHTLTVSHYIDRYQRRGKLTSTNLLKGILTTVGVGTLLALGGSFFLPIGALLGKALVISTVANFTWLGLSINDSISAHNRYLAMEQAMLTGTSEQVKDNLSFLRKVEATRLRAILSGTIGLSLGASSLGPILRSIHNGTKPMQISALSHVVNPKRKFVFE